MSQVKGDEGGGGKDHRQNRQAIDENMNASKIHREPNQALSASTQRALQDIDKKVAMEVEQLLERPAVAPVVDNQMQLHRQETTRKTGRPLSPAVGSTVEEFEELIRRRPLIKALRWWNIVIKEKRETWRQIIRAKANIQLMKINRAWETWQQWSKQNKDERKKLKSATNFWQIKMSSRTLHRWALSLAIKSAQEKAFEEAVAFHNHGALRIYWQLWQCAKIQRIRCIEKSMVFQNDKNNANASQFSIEKVVESLERSPSPDCTAKVAVMESKNQDKIQENIRSKYNQRMMRTSYFCWKDKANRHILLRKYLQRRDKEYYLGRVFNCIYTAYKENSIKRLLNSKVKSVKERLRKKAGLRRRVSSIQSMTAKYCANRAFEKWIHHTRLTLKAKHAQLVIVKNRDFRLTGNVFRLWKRKGYLQRALNQFCRYRASEYICRDYWQRWRQSLREGMHHTTQSQKADLHYNGRVKKIVFQRMTQIHSEWQCKNHVLLEKGRDFRIFWKLRHSFPKWKAHFNARRYQKKCTQKAVELWRLLAKARYVREWKSFTVRRAFLSNKLDEVKERQRARVLKRHFVVWDARLFRRKKEMHDKMEACKQIQHQQYIKTGDLKIIIMIVVRVWTSRLKRALQSWNSAYKKRIREHCLDKRARNHFAHNSNKNVFSRWIHLARQRKESKRLDEQAQEFSRVWVLRMSVGQWQASLDKSRIRLHQLVAALSKWKLYACMMWNKMVGFHPKAGLGKMGMFFKDEEALPRQIGPGRSIPLSGNRNKNAEKLGDEFLNGIITTHSNGKGLPTKSCGGYEQRYF
eukprot:jgi/Bigna1/142728/aug1.72_g17436